MKKIPNYYRGLRDALAMVSAFRAYDLLGFWRAVAEYAIVWLAIHAVFLLVAFVMNLDKPRDGAVTPQ